MLTFPQQNEYHFLDHGAHHRHPACVRPARPFPCLLPVACDRGSFSEGSAKKHTDRLHEKEREETEPASYLILDEPLYKNTNSYDDSDKSREVGSTKESELYMRETREESTGRVGEK